MRGVMESARIAVQRIQNGKIQHTVKMVQAGRPATWSSRWDDQAACQQDLPGGRHRLRQHSRPRSAVMKPRPASRTTPFLAISTQGRAPYSGKLRNPNPKMPDYGSLPLSRVEYNKKNVPPVMGKSTVRRSTAAATAQSRRAVNEQRRTPAPRRHLQEVKLRCCRVRYWCTTPQPVVDHE